jgi:folate-binding protein YgfZ
MTINACRIMPSIISDRSVIKISGPDRGKFLQNLVTNDVMSNVEAVYAMMLSPQGRFLFDMFIIPVAHGYLLDIFTGTKDLFLQKLRMYKINMQIEINHLDTLHVGYISCSEYALGAKYSITDVAKPHLMQNYVMTMYKDVRHKALGYRVILDEYCKNDNLYLVDKYTYAIPDGGIDLLYDKAMPQEYGAEQLNAISYNKGCYIGQESVSRTKSQGVVRKKIYKVTADFDLSNIQHGSEISFDGAKIGIFCSGYLQEGIALIREVDLAPLCERDCKLNNRVIKLHVANFYNI